MVKKKNKFIVTAKFSYRGPLRQNQLSLLENHKNQSTVHDAKTVDEKSCNAKKKYELFLLRRTCRPVEK